ncbi:unnamed protein product, partial [marine sediment metagenome]
AETLTGWKEKDVLGKDLPEVFPIKNEETGTLTENPAVKALREGAVVDLENHVLLIAKDGTETPILDSAAPIRDDQGNITGAVLVFRNLTERQGRKDILKESVEKYRAVVESTKVRRRMPVILTEEEIEKLKIQPKLKETYYLKELKKRKRQGARSLKRIENKIFNARRNNAIIVLLYSSGIRLAELVNLDLADIDLKERQLKVRAKNGNESYSPLTQEAVGTLKSYIEVRKARGNAEDEALFTTRTGERIKRRDIQRIVPKYAKEAGINKKVTPHTLRHSIAIHLLDRGMNLGYVQAFLRHASASTTQIYTPEVSNRRLK